MTNEREFDLRGFLASKLICWHRLTVPEVDNLLEVFDAATAQLQPQTSAGPGDLADFIAWAENMGEDTTQSERDDRMFENDRTEVAYLAFTEVRCGAAQPRTLDAPVSEVDYVAAIAAAKAKNSKWVPGTGGRIAFAKGAEWQLAAGRAPVAQPPSQIAAPAKCSPTLTECPRCKNNIIMCDGIFQEPSAPVAPIPAPTLLTELERTALNGLLDLAYAAWNAADNSEQRRGTPESQAEFVIHEDYFEPFEDKLNALEELPDDQPGYFMELAAKARWALRRLLDTQQVAPPPVAQAEPTELSHQQITDKLHLYEEIAEHYAECNISPEALRDWVADRIDKPSKVADSRDAARYRWLRDESNWSDDGICPMVASCEDTLYGEALDKAVDAAIKAKDATP